MGVNSIPPGSPHVHPMWALGTCGEPNEIKKNTHPKNNTALFHEQAHAGHGHGAQGPWQSGDIETNTGVRA